MWQLQILQMQYIICNNYIQYVITIIIFIMKLFLDIYLLLLFLFSCYIVQPHRLYVACQASLFMGFEQANWHGLAFPSPGNLLNQGIEHVPPALADRFFTAKPPGKPWISIMH